MQFYRKQGYVLNVSDIFKCALEKVSTSNSKTQISTQLAGVVNATALLKHYMFWCDQVPQSALGDRVSIPNRGRGFFLCPPRPNRSWAPPSLLYNGYRGFVSRGKLQPRRDAHHTPHSCAEVTKERGCTSYPPPQAPFMACTGSTLLFYFLW
jgi:hypothetical protein